MKVSMTGVTYGEFSRLGKKRGWTVEMLVEQFKGKTGIEDRSDNFHESLKSYFDRVLSCHWLNPDTRRTEDRSNAVIPYRSIIEFYQKELSYQPQRSYKAQEFGKRACACGCGEAVFGPRQKWALPGCKKKLQRDMSVTAEMAQP